ncbi:MAG: transglutaminase domain-containing protein [Blautia sp.]
MRRKEWMMVWLLVLAVVLNGCTGRSTVEELLKGQGLSSEQEPLEEQEKTSEEKNFSVWDILQGQEQEPLPEETISTEEEAYLYGYGTLTEDQKTIYRQILKGIRERSDTVKITACPQEELNYINNLVFVDHPGLFWLEQQNYSYDYKEEKKDVTILELSLVYNVEKDLIDELQEQIDRVAEQWCAQAPQDGTVYDRIRYVYEFLGANVRYEKESMNNQNIQSVFLNQSTVCMGFAKATQYLLQKMGIFCTLVTGKVVPDNMEHAWNLVKMGDNYYYVDTTWGSPGFSSEEGTIQDFSYTYLCCTEDTIRVSHTPDESLPLPSCTDDSYNYYKIQGSWYDTFDEETIYQILGYSIIEGRKKEDFKFADEDSYAQAVEALAQGNLVERAVQDFYPFEPGETYSWNVGYSDWERLLTVYW